MADKNKFERIFLHCSDSTFGTALMINKWHLDRGWKMCGYHSVIQNGYPNAGWYNKKIIIPYLEGAVEIGRQINSDSLFTPDEMGAQVKGMNYGSFGICMIGKNEFSNKVLNTALEVVKFRAKQFELGYSETQVIGHYESDSEKTCPNIDMNEFRKKLNDGKKYGEKLTIEVNNTENKEIKELTFSKFLKFFQIILTRIFNNEKKNKTAITGRN